MKLAILCLIIAVFLIGTSCRPAAAPVAVSNKPVSINDRATGNAPTSAPTKPIGEMTWTDEQGRVQRIADFQGKALILDFWATDCPPCVKEIPRLMALQQKYGADNVALIGLHVGDDEDRAKVPAFYKEHKLNYPIAFPDDRLTSLVFSDGDEIPRTVVIDRQGRIVTRTIGFGDAIDDQLTRAVGDATSAN